MVRYFFNASCRIDCNEQQIQVYLDTTAKRFASFIKKLWPLKLEFKLWSWNIYPATALVLLSNLMNVNCFNNRAYRDQPRTLR